MSYIDYQNKITTLEKAAQLIESGDVVWLGSTVSISNSFLDRLAKRAGELKNVTLIGDMFINTHELLTDTKYQDSFKIISLVPKQQLPTPMGNVSFVYRSIGSVEETICKRYGVNTIAVEVCPPDENGMCNFGAFGAHRTSYVNRYSGIKKRILIINDNQPIGGGEDRDFISLSDCDSIVVSHHKLFSGKSAT